jgi:hypothetical protein
MEYSDEIPESELELIGQHVDRPITYTISIVTAITLIGLFGFYAITLLVVSFIPFFLLVILYLGIESYIIYGLTKWKNKFRIAFILITIPKIAYFVYQLFIHFTVESIESGLLFVSIMALLIFCFFLFTFGLNPTVIKKFQEDYLPPGDIALKSPNRIITFEEHAEDPNQTTKKN